MPFNPARCSTALCCANVTFQGGTQAPNYLEVIDQFNVPSVPVGVDRFFAVFELKDGAPGVYTTKLRIEGPGDFFTDLRTMDISFTTENINARIAIEIRQFVFPDVGRYKVALQIRDEEVGFFTIDIKRGVPGGLFMPPQVPQGG